MRRLLAILCVALLAAGCQASDKPAHIAQPPTKVCAVLEGADRPGTEAANAAKGIVARRGAQVRFVPDSVAGQLAMEGFLEDGCNLQVVFGANLEAAATKLAMANPKVHFVFASMPLRSTELPENVKPVRFNLSTSAFQAGYAGARYTRTKKLAVVAGDYSNVSATVLANFSAGMSHFDLAHPHAQPSLSNTTDEGEGFYLGAMAAPEQGEEAAKQLYETDADVIVAAASEQANNALIRTLIKERSADREGEKKTLGVILLGPPDVAKALGTEQAKQLVIGAVVRNWEAALRTVLEQVRKKGFSSAPYIASEPEEETEFQILPDGAGPVTKAICEAASAARKQFAKDPHSLVEPKPAPGQIDATTFRPPTEKSDELAKKLKK